MVHSLQQLLHLWWTTTVNTLFCKSYWHLALKVILKIFHVFLSCFSSCFKSLHFSLNYSKKQQYAQRTKLLKFLICCYGVKAPLELQNDAHWVTLVRQSRQKQPARWQERKSYLTNKSVVSHLIRKWLYVPNQTSVLQKPCGRFFTYPPYMDRKHKIFKLLLL